jgi:type II secretory pathway pseudopilin PulG
MLTDNNNDEIAALKNQVFTLLVALIVVSGTLTITLYRQASLTRKDMATIQQQNQQIAAVLNQDAALIGAFVPRLMAYGEKHPDFLPVLKKYGIAPGQTAPAATPAAPKK